MTTLVDRRGDTGSSQAIKPPVVTYTTENITLSGEQTINSVAVVSGDRVLVKDQTDSAENGIYDANTGTWTRASDFNDTSETVNGTVVFAQDGGAAFQLTSTITTFGTSPITFVQINITQASQDAADALAAAQAALGISLLL